jgi:Domain of unknown function (DUF5047)
MRDADTLVQRALLGSGKITTYADVYYDGEQIVDNLSITDGSITSDITQDVRHRLDLTVADADGRLVPRLEFDPLNAYGQEINIQMAITGSGVTVTEPLSIGWYVISEGTTEELWTRNDSGVWRSGGAEIVLTGLDRMQFLADARFLSPSQPLVDATVFSEITRLVNDLVPLGVFDDILVDRTVPASLVYEDDRVAALALLAASIGAEIHVNSDGALDVAVPTQYGATPVWTFNVGESGDVLATQLAWKRDGVVNAVIARGQTAVDNAPVQGTAFDLDPSSPTRWGGPIGQVPLFFESPLLTTTAQCGAAAKTRLNSYRRGMDREYTFPALPNYLLELDDPVVVNFPDRSFVGRITRMVLPIKAITPMSVTVRALDSSVTLVS